MSSYNQVNNSVRNLVRSFYFKKLNNYIYWVRKMQLNNFKYKSELCLERHFEIYPTTAQSTTE